MKSFGYAALALLLIALLVGLVSATFTPVQGPQEAVAPSEVQSSTASVAPDRVDPATTGAERGHDVSAGLRRDETGLGSLLFVVRDLRSVPLPGVLIRLRSEFGEQTVFTGSVGEAVFDGLVAGHYSYRLESIGRPDLTAGPLALAQGEERLLELRVDDYDRSIAGRVLDQGGEPVGGITVTARPYRGQTGTQLAAASEQRTESGPDGWFEITGLGEGDQELKTLATDRYAASRAIMRAGTDGAVLSITEFRVLQLAGQVTNSAGQPLAGVAVSRVRGQGQQTETDAAGRYALSVDDLGTDRRPLLRFELEGYRPEQKVLRPSALRGAGPVHLDARLVPIERPIEVLAYLVDERGAPVEGQSIELYSRRSNTTYHGTSDAQGEVTLPNVLPGFDYRLTVEPTARYRTVSWSMVDLTRARAPLEIVLESLPTGRVWGRMVDVSGYPVPHFSMWLQSDEAQGRWIKVTGDSVGFFEIGDVPEGRLRLQTLSRPMFRTTGVELAAGSDAYVEVVLDWGEHVLAGTVTGEGGEPLAGARVQLNWRGDWWLMDTHQSIRQTVADSAGAFVFSGLGGGPYDLRASAPGHLTRQIDSQFSGERVEVRLPSAED